MTYQMDKESVLVYSVQLSFKLTLRSAVVFPQANSTLIFNISLCKMHWNEKFLRVFSIALVSTMNHCALIETGSPTVTNTWNSHVFKPQLPLKGKFCFCPWLNRAVRFAFVWHWKINDGKLELTMYSDYSYSIQYSPDVTNHVYPTRESAEGRERFPVIYWCMQYC